MLPRPDQDRTFSRSVERKPTRPPEGQKSLFGTGNIGAVTRFAEFGPDQPAGESYEKRLFDAQIPPTLGAGEDGFVSQTIVFRDGPDITSTITGVIQAGTPVHVLGVGELNYLQVTFDSGGVSHRQYIYGAALKAKDAP
jgi:hypothetical protein